MGEAGGDALPCGTQHRGFGQPLGPRGPRGVRGSGGSLPPAGFIRGRVRLLRGVGSGSSAGSAQVPPPGRLRLLRRVAGTVGRSTRRSRPAAPPWPRSRPPLPAPAGMGVWSRGTTVASSFATRSWSVPTPVARFPGTLTRPCAPISRSLPGRRERSDTLGERPRPRNSASRQLSAPLVAAAEQRWVA